VALCHPVLHYLRFMGLQVVQDQKYLPSRASQQPAQEHEEQGVVHRLGVGHEADLPLVADGRNLIHPDMLLWDFHLCRLAFTGIATCGVLVVGHPRLVAPVDLRALLRSSLLDGRVGLLQPLPYYPGKEVGQAFQPEKAQSQAGKPDLHAFLSCRVNTSSGSCSRAWRRGTWTV